MSTTPKIWPQSNGSKTDNDGEKFWAFLFEENGGTKQGS